MAEDGGGTVVGGGRQRAPGRTPRAPGRGRLVLAVLSVGMAVTVAVVLVSRVVVRAEWWQVRHTVTTDPVAPLAELGPPAGPLAVSWQRSAQVRRGPLTGYGGVAFAVAQGQAVTASGRGLEVRDARTGAARWSYRRVGWTMLGWSATRSRLVGHFERDGDRGERQMIGFDALSGGVLWRRAGERPAAATRKTLRWPGGSGMVLTTGKDRTTVDGRSADDGSRRWTQRLPAGCRLFEDAAHPSDGVEALSVLALDCDGRSRLLALEPSTGRVRWTRSLGSAEAPDVQVLDGITLASDGTALRVFGPDGAQITVWNGDELCGDAMCPAALAGGRLLVVRRPEGAGGGKSRMDAVQVSSGRTEWSREVPAYAALAQAGGRVYALRPKLDERLLPAGVDVVDPGGGRATTVPVPFAMDPALSGVRPWLEAAGGLLYVAVPEAAPRPTGSARLVALRGGPAGAGPAELGGAVAADWPDACGLLKESDLAAARLEGRFTTRPGRAALGDVRLPHPVTCAYDMKGGRPDRSPVPDGSPAPTARPGREGSADPSPKPEPSRSTAPSASSEPSETSGSSEGPERRDGERTPAPSPSSSRDARDDSPWGERGPTVTVKWVAPNAQAASALLQTLQATQSQARRRTDIGADEAFEIGPTPGTIAFRVDRYIVMVEASSPPGVAARLARAVSARLPTAR
ncbi:PQQ-binding-like beta-propeller repeat protein [Actinomadura viridis]|uniref:outer membrane protein assembly factor BamB family protein n=1 Tax=Actinomadura viridis TaxID=58110 RepID=UPI0036CE7ABD